MSFIKKLFGNSKEKEVEKTPVEVIEEELNILFPSRFKQFMIDKLPKDNAVKIDLLDGPYKFLDSLFEKEILDHNENVISVSNDLNSSYYPEEKEFVKIPFAKSTEGDGFKYLYFIAEKHKEATETVYLRDTDSPATGRIPLCNQLAFILTRAGIVNNHTLVTNLSLNFSEINSMIEIPDFINIWENYGTSIRDETKEDNCDIELYLSNYIMDNKEENISKIEIQVDMNYQNKRIQSAMAFEVAKAGLQIQFAENINYRIFYHKLVCIIGTLAHMATDLKKNHNIDITNYLNTLPLQGLTKQGFRGIEEQYM